MVGENVFANLVAFHGNMQWNPFGFESHAFKKHQINNIICLLRMGACLLQDDFRCESRQIMIIGWCQKTNLLKQTMQNKCRTR